MKSPNSPPEEYDLLVLGSGAGGKLTAWTLARKGMKTAVIERNAIFTHPTMPEGLIALFSNVPPLAAPKPSRKPVRRTIGAV